MACKKTFQDLCRECATEGIVLLKNENNVLPLKKGNKVSVFGRIQTNYIKSGTGSGGLVKTEYTVGIPEGLRNAGILLNKELFKQYVNWEKDNPFDKGKGWAKEPWCQVEMEIDDADVISASENSDAAIIIIGRTAGEDRDNKAEKGSFLLTDTEEDLLKKVTAHFEKVIVLLNVGNIIDMKWINKYPIDAVLYVWQGGQEGGNAIADVLVGNVSPSGRLSDTVATDISDYPSTKNFGNLKKNIYEEDIYVGYRYFSTFCKGKIMFPFGYGLSYSEFEYSNAGISVEDDMITAVVTVKNIGTYPAKEVIEIYVKAPMGLLGKPEKVLAGYKKTKELLPNESETVTISFDISEVASFDDEGITGNKSCFVLEKGNYKISISKDSLTEIFSGNAEIEETKVTKKCNKALYPNESFDRIKPKTADGRTVVSFEKVTASVNNENIVIPKEIGYTGDKGITLYDVKQGKKSIEEFIAQLSDKELACISFGEGMNSPKVTSQTACAFGGVTDSLLKKGIPVACATDGPSGIRMAEKATLMPNGTLLACTFNDELIEEMFVFEGEEMAKNNIDVILGPGINIRRNPLNGRNFEYFSEDPLLTGKMAVAICKGLSRSGSHATVKHFAANNQEQNRYKNNSVLSARALREIYLKPFEIAVQSGYVKSIMTSYNMINGCYAAGNYDLTTVILRNDWNYDGFVMTDWWAKTEEEFTLHFEMKEDSKPWNFVPMVLAQNDVYMTLEDAQSDKNTLIDALEKSEIKKSVLQRNAINICNFLMNCNAFGRTNNVPSNISEAKETVMMYSVENICQGEEYSVDIEESGKYKIELVTSFTEAKLSQNTVKTVLNNNCVNTAILTALDKKTEFETEISSGKNSFFFDYPQSIMKIERLNIYKIKKTV